MGRERNDRAIYTHVHARTRNVHARSLSRAIGIDGDAESRMTAGFISKPATCTHTIIEQRPVATSLKFGQSRWGGAAEFVEIVVAATRAGGAIIAA